MSVRTDVHRPSAPEFDPEKYDCLGVFDMHPDDGNRMDHARTVNNVVALHRWTFKGAPHGTCQCSHCGAYLRYVALMVYRPTGTLMHIGETCLGERFEAMTRADFQELRAHAAKKSAETRAAHAANMLRQAAREWLDLSDERLSELSYVGNGGLVDQDDVLTDMAGYLRRTGELTVGQENYALKIIERVVTRENRLAAEKLLPTIPAPVGRVTVTGEIVHVKLHEDMYGSTFKIIVRDDRGFKVWTTMPSALRPDSISGGAPEIYALKGKRVRFDAALSRSDRDASFAFGKRPTKASVLG